MERIHGLYLWDDEDWNIPPPNQLPASGVREKSSKSNNFHFGQVKVSAGDSFIFSTDGLGDSFDPTRIFVTPERALSYGENLGYENLWQNENASVADSKGRLFGVDILMKNWTLYANKLKKAAVDDFILKILVINDILKTEDKEEVFHYFFFLLFLFSHHRKVFFKNVSTFRFFQHLECVKLIRKEQRKILLVSTKQRFRSFFRIKT